MLTWENADVQLQGDMPAHALTVSLGVVPLRDAQRLIFALWHGCCRLPWRLGHAADLSLTGWHNDCSTPPQC